MALSKPKEMAFNLISAYLGRLYTSPVKTKAITSCVIAAFGNFLSQKISGAKSINEDSLLAFALFGLLFGGTVPHYFYKGIQPFVRRPILLLLIERFLYTPCFQALVLYMLAKFECKSHAEASAQMKKLIFPMVLDNWKYLTLLHFLNMKYSPPMLRVLGINLIGFFWSIYLSQQRMKAAKAKGARK